MLIFLFIKDLKGQPKILRFRTNFMYWFVEPKKDRTPLNFSVIFSFLFHFRHKKSLRWALNNRRCHFGLLGFIFSIRAFFYSDVLWHHSIPYVRDLFLHRWNLTGKFPLCFLRFDSSQCFHFIFRFTVFRELIFMFSFFTATGKRPLQVIKDPYRFKTYR